MAALTEAQKKRLKAHSKSQTATHMKAMATLMRAGKSFSEAHATASKKSVKQKQKQSQSQKVVVNIGTIPRRRGRKPRAKPRPLSYQQDTARVLAQFAQPIGMPQSFNPTPTIYKNPTPQPFRPEVSQAAPPQLNRPSLAEELELARPIKPPAPLSSAPTPKEEQRSMKIEEIRSRLAERAKGARRNANLDDTKAEAAEQPIPLDYGLGVPPMSRNVSDITTAPNTPYADPFAEDDNATQEY